MEIGWGGWGDGERGIEKHLPSLLESRAVITGPRGGGKQHRHTRDKSSTPCAFNDGER